MSEILELNVGSATLIEWDQVSNAITGQYVNSATVSFRVLTEAGVEFVASTSMPYVSASDGRYCGTLPHDAGIELDVNYWLEISTTVGGSTSKPRVRAKGVYQER